MSLPLRIEDCTPHAATPVRRATRRSRPRVRPVFVFTVALAAYGLYSLAASAIAALAPPGGLRYQPGDTGILTVMRSNAIRHAGYIDIVGDATQAGGARVVAGEVEARLLDRAGNTVGIDSAVAVENGAAARAVVPFRVMLHDSPAAVAYQLRFTGRTR